MMIVRNRKRRKEKSMGYSVQGFGEVIIKEKNKQKIQEIKELLEQEFEITSYYRKDESRRDTTILGLYYEGKYCEEEIYQVLNDLANMTCLVAGNIEFEGEYEDYWRTIWKNGEWTEETGMLIYYEPEKDPKAKKEQQNKKIASDDFVCTEAVLCRADVEQVINGLAHKQWIKTSAIEEIFRECQNDSELTKIMYSAGMTALKEKITKILNEKQKEM